MVTRAARRVVVVMGLLLVPALGEAAQGAAGARPPAWTPRVDYDCAGAPLSVWYEGRSAILFVDGRLETFRSTRSGSGAKYTNDRREWFTRGDEGVLSAVGQTAATQLRCQLTPLMSWRPYLALRRYTCADGLTVDVSSELERAMFTFRGETTWMREVTVRAGTLYTDGVSAWRGMPTARMLAEADGDGAFARGCHPGTVEPTATLEGTVTYRTRQALPAGAVVELRLMGLPRAGAAAIALARQVLVTRGEQVPVAFSMTYAPGVVEDGRAYEIQATIRIDGRVRFRATSPVALGPGPGATPLTIEVRPSR